MGRRCLLYYITDRKYFPGNESARQHRLLEKIAEAARAGVDYIQLREKDLSARELESLASEAMSVIRKLRTENGELETALLVNSRIDVALATAESGVHLRSDDISAADVRKIWQSGTGVPARETQIQKPIVGVSCHSLDEVARAASEGVSFAVFGPVFEKHQAEAAGLAKLQEACRTTVPILALGRVTQENAQSCLAVGAAGVAAIRLFQENEIAAVVRNLRHC